MPAPTKFIYDKVPPQNQEVEKAILSLLLNYGYLIIRIADNLHPEHFYNDINATIYRTIYEMHNQDVKEIDLLTVVQWLRKKKELDKIGGHYYLSELAKQTQAPLHLEYYCNLIISLAVKRGIIEKAHNAMMAAYDENNTGNDIIDTFGLELINLSQNKASTTRQIKELTETNNKRINAIRSGEIKRYGIPTLLTDVDEYINGLQTPDLIVIAARPGQGKSSLAINLLSNISISQNIPCLFFSLEMSSEQLELRLESLHSSIPYYKLQNGKFSDAQRLEYENAQSIISKAPIYFDDDPSLTPERLRTKAIRMKYQYDIKVIFIDYLQLLEHAKSYNNREAEVSHISRSLKKLAKELEVPIVVLSQLNRETEKGGNGEPKLSNLRESGAIEQDADIVILMWRPGEYGLKEINKGNETISTENLCVLNLAKHRNGPVGKVLTSFYSDNMSFKNYGFEKLETVNNDIPF